MRSLDDFLPGIRPYAPGVSDPTAYFAIRQALIEFCERTRVWKFEDEFPILGQAFDPIYCPAGAVIHEIDECWFNGLKLRKVTPEKMDQLAPYWRAGSAQIVNPPLGNPQWVTQTEPNNLIFVPYGPGTVHISLYLKPAQDAMEVPDYLLDQHRETIAWGALARILLIPNQSFTNPKMAETFGASFQERVGGRMGLGTQGQQRAPVRAKGHFF